MDINIKGEVHPKIKISQFVDFEALSSVVKVPSPCDTPFWRYLNSKFTMTSCSRRTPCDVKEIQVPGLLACCEQERVAFVEFLSCDMNSFSHDASLLCCQLL